MAAASRPEDRPSSAWLRHALTIDAAQGITSDEHIDALPRGTAGVTAFTSYVAESRSRGTTWTVISEGAVLEAERHRQALGDITPITRERLWERAAEDMSEKPYKALGIDLLAAALRGREQAVDTYIATHHIMDDAQLNDPDAGPKALRRLQAAAVNENLAATSRRWTRLSPRMPHWSAIPCASGRPPTTCARSAPKPKRPRGRWKTRAPVRRPAPRREMRPTRR